MRIALISNLREGKGLARDAAILDALLQKWGNDVVCYDFRDVDRRDYFHTIVIHLEIVAPKALSWSDKHVWIPNPDWARPDHMRWADAFRVICAKSWQGERELLDAGLKRVVYTGFESEDRRLDGVPRERAFFHSWSGSLMKGTKQVLAALGFGKMASYPRSFMIDTKRMPEAKYKYEQNRCLFWLQPSAVEGYGHCIHEGLSVGALVATLDAPPMNQAQGIDTYIKARKVSRQYLADVYEARPEAIAEAAEGMWGLSDTEIAYRSAAAREGFLQDRAEFRSRFREVLESL